MGTPTRRRGGSRYGLAALRQAPVRARNNRLNRAAFCLGMLVSGGKLDDGLVEDELLAGALCAGLPEPEARASLASGLRAGAWSPPPGS